ncbi:MAG: hypothetical protein R3362_05360 [Rhodothermales bacterium]|nr:hypothetical protein [Rhodothermales bacterium]
MKRFLHLVGLGACTALHYAFTTLIAVGLIAASERQPRSELTAEYELLEFLMAPLTPMLGTSLFDPVIGFLNSVLWGLGMYAVLFVVGWLLLRAFRWAYGRLRPPQIRA